MNRRRLLVAGGIAAIALGLAWLLFVELPRHAAPPVQRAATAPAPPAPAAENGAAPAGRRITARLFYVADDGLGLVPVEREVPFGETTADQARALVTAQIAPVQPPLVSAVPAGTTLEALYVTDKGDAYVDLSPEVAQNHPGGTTAELLTVYTIVDAITVNLPAITGVQILVGGREVDTLAGHVDLRRPLQKNLTFVETPPPATPGPGKPTGKQ